MLSAWLMVSTVHCRIGRGRLVVINLDWGHGNEDPVVQRKAQVHLGR